MTDWLAPRDQLGLHEHARPERPVAILERGLDAHVSRRLVDDRIQCGHASGLGFRIGLVERDPHVAADLDQVRRLLRHVEVHIDRAQRLQLDDRVSVFQVLPDVDLADAEDAGKRRADRLAIDRRANLADARLALLLLRRGTVELRFGHHLLGEQALHAVVVQLRQVALGLDRRQLRPLLTGVELDEHFTGAHVASGVEIDSLDHARQIGADRDALHRGDSADRAERGRPRVRLRDNRRHCFGWRLKGRAFGHRRLNLFELHEAERGHEYARQRQHQDHPFRHKHLSPPSRPPPRLWRYGGTNISPLPLRRDVTGAHRKFRATEVSACVKSRKLLYT